MKHTFKKFDFSAVLKKHVIHLAFLSLALLGWITASSQEVNAYEFSPITGFDYKVVYDVKEAPNGHLWFGTAHGLLHYDGHNVEAYSAIGYDNEVTNISFEEDGSVWCVNFGGQIFKTQGDSLIPAVQQSYNGHIIQQFKLLNTGQILYVTQNDNRVMTFHPESKEHTVFYELEKGAYLHDINFNHRPMPVAQSLNGQLQIDFISEEGQLVKRSPRCDQRLNTGSIRLHSVKQGEYFISAVRNVLTLVDMSTGKVVYVDDFTNSVDCNNIIWRDGKFLILKKNSICIADLDKGEGYTDVMLQNISASQVLRDREGNTWVSSIDEGVFIIPNLAVKHQILTESKLVSAVSDSLGSFYLYTNNGEFYECKWPYDKTRLISTEGFKAHSLSYNPYRHVVQLGAVNRYFNITSGVIEYRTSFNQAYKVIHAIDEFTEVSTYSQKAILYAPEDSAGTGIQWGDVEGMNRPHNYKLRGKRALDIGSDGMGNVYIDYIDGLMHYAVSNSPKFVEFKGRRLVVSALGSNSTIGVWAITLGNELLHIDKGEVVYSKRLPQKVNRVFCKDNLVYLASNQGVLIYNPEKSTFRVIDKAVGLIADKVLEVVKRDSVLFVLGERYLQRIPLNIHTEAPLPPVVSIKNFKVHGADFGLHDDLDLSFSQNDIRIDFAVLSTKSRGDYEVLYRLGATHGWNQIPANTASVSLPQLAPGDYTFELKACNSNGTCSVPQIIRFTVASPFYKEWWFYVLIFGVALVCVVLLYQYRLRQKQTQIRWVKEQEKLKGALYKSQTKAIQSQMNPHFLFNALNSVQDLVLMEDIEGSNKYLGKFSDLLRKILQSSRVTTISLSDEMEILELYLSLEKLRFGEDFLYELKCNIAKEDAQKLMLPAMIIQPFAENAIKHGLFHKKGAKHLRIEFFIEGAQLICEIEDNGIGRQKSREIAKKRTQLHGGFSTQAVKERIVLMEQTLQKEIEFATIDLPSQKGTMVRIKLPLDIPSYGS